MIKYNNIYMNFIKQSLDEKIEILKKFFELHILNIIIYNITFIMGLICKTIDYFNEKEYKNSIYKELEIFKDLFYKLLPLNFNDLNIEKFKDIINLNLINKLDKITKNALKQNNLK